jgi:hypothetical protein
MYGSSFMLEEVFREILEKTKEMAEKVTPGSTLRIRIGFSFFREEEEGELFHDREDVFFAFESWKLKTLVKHRLPEIYALKRGEKGALEGVTWLRDPALHNLLEEAEGGLSVFFHTLRDELKKKWAPEEAHDEDHSEKSTEP